MQGGENNYRNIFTLIHLFHFHLFVFHFPPPHTHTHTQLLYVSSDPKDYQKEFKDSLMYRIIDFHLNPILLNITIPPGPEATPTTTNVTEGGTIMKIISINEENKGKERSNINLYYNKKIINHYIIQYRDTGTS